jgi:hypothetical protein
VGGFSSASHQESQAETNNFPIGKAADSADGICNTWSFDACALSQYVQLVAVHKPLTVYVRDTTEVSFMTV